MRLDRVSYFIGTNPAGNPALYRVGLGGNAEELVENVHDMQFRYGLDTDDNGTVDMYTVAPGNWTQVASVTINLLMRSPDNNLSTATQTVTYDNGTTGIFNAPDRRLYQVYSATVGVRNRLPSM
jgi:type IV pilus assembly protein PilW